MSKAENFIQDCTRDGSNELISVESRAGKEVISYNKWLTPDQALKAIEIERQETINDMCDCPNLTWEDIELIVNIDKDTNNEESIIGVRKNEEHYKEILKRFLDLKKKNNYGNN